MTVGVWDEKRRPTSGRRFACSALTVASVLHRGFPQAPEFHVKPGVDRCVPLWTDMRNNLSSPRSGYSPLCRSEGVDTVKGAATGGGRQPDGRLLGSAGVRDTASA